MNPYNAIDAALRVIRRVGLPAWVDERDLRQEAALAILEAKAPQSARLRFDIAKKAMIDFLRRTGKHHRGMESLNVNASGAHSAIPRYRDVFFNLPPDDGKAYRSLTRQKKEGPIKTLASLHAEWERERAERWAHV